MHGYKLYFSHTIGKHLHISDSMCGPAMHTNTRPHWVRSCISHWRHTKLARAQEAAIWCRQQNSNGRNTARVVLVNMQAGTTSKAARETCSSAWCMLQAAEQKREKIHSESNFENNISDLNPKTRARLC